MPQPRDRGAPAYFVAVRRTGSKAGETVNVSHLVESFEFKDNERKVDVLRLTVDNFDLRNFDDPLWAHGNIVVFSFGYDGDMAPIREAVIRSVKGSLKLEVEAHDRAVEMDKIKIRQSYENVTRSEVIRLIAERNGYSGDQLNLEETNERFEILSQCNQSDAEYVRKLCEQEGFEFFVDFDGFHAHSRDVGQAPIREYVYYTDPEQGWVINWTVENDITRKPARVRVKSRDPITKETVTGVADNQTDEERELLQELKALEEILTIDGESGAVSTEPAPGKTQPVAYEQDVPGNMQSAEEAQTDARRRFRKSTQRAVKMSMELVGDPGLLAKAVVKLTGFSTRLSGKYYVKEVTHNLSGSGPYVCSVKLITDGYQRRFGAGKGQQNRTTANANALAAALRALDDAAALVNTASVNSAVARTLQVGNTAVNGGQTKPQLNALVKAAGGLTRVVKSAGNASTGDERNRLTGVLAAAGALYALAKRLANQEDVEAKGKLNTKDVVSPRTKKERIDISGESGAVTFTTTSRGQ